MREDAKSHFPSCEGSRNDPAGTCLEGWVAVEAACGVFDPPGGVVRVRNVVPLVTGLAPRRVVEGGDSGAACVGHMFLLESRAAAAGDAGTSSGSRRADLTASVLLVQPARGSPVVPRGHKQLNPPGVSRQMAEAAQLAVPRAHSSMSIAHVGPSYLPRGACKQSGPTPRVGCSPMQRLDGCKLGQQPAQQRRIAPLVGTGACSRGALTGARRTPRRRHPRKLLLLHRLGVGGDEPKG